jgi:hypothetical protein
MGAGTSPLKAGCPHPALASNCRLRRVGSRSLHIRHPVRAQARLPLCSCPLCASWFNPPPLFAHEGHQRHESDPRNPGPTLGPRPGGPTDDSPALERWVPSHHQHPASAGRQNPFPHTNTSIRSRHQSTTTPRNTNRISRKASKPQSPQVDEQPARQTLAARVGIGIGIGIGIENSNRGNRLRSQYTPAASRPPKPWPQARRAVR